MEPLKPKKRLIPKLLLSNRDNNLVVVITKYFDKRILIGDPLSQSKIFQDQSADELIFLNIGNTGIKSLCEVIARVSEEIFMPLTVGGGVRSDNDFRQLLKYGADKISINTVAVKNPKFITEMAYKYGAQCVVVSIDYRIDEEGKPLVYIENGKTKTNLDPVSWAKQAEEFGAGELLICCINQDGSKDGLELEVLKKITEVVKIPVIGSGGCGMAIHFVDGFISANCDAVCAGTFFAHRDQNLIQTRSQIFNSGVNIRMQN